MAEEELPESVRRVIDGLKRTRINYSLDGKTLLFATRERRPYLIRVPDWPEDWSISVDIPSASDLEFRAGRIASVAVRAGDRSSINLEGQVAWMSVTGGGDEGPTKVAASDIESFVCEEGAHTQITANVARIAIAAGGVVHIRRPSVPEVTISGVTSITGAGRTVEINDLIVEADAVLLTGGNDILLRHVRFPDKQTRLQLGAPTDLGAIDGSGVLTLSENRLSLKGSVESQSFDGKGEVRVGKNSTLSAPSFEPGSDLRLVVESGIVIGGTGDLAVLEVEPGQTIRGGDAPLSPREILCGDGAAILNINLYRTSLQGLENLRPARLLSPWLAPRWGVLRRGRQETASQREDSAVPVESSDEVVLATARAQFWATLSEILAEKHAPGATRSEVRYAAHRTRRKSLKWRRERWLLTLYAPLGYGERIVQPLLCMVLLAALGSYIVTSEHWLHAFLWLLIAPLEFFRFLHVPQAGDPGLAEPLFSGVVDAIILVGMRVLGLFLVVLSLIAARRVVRAE